MSVRTRFAPSPTGYLHIGGVRTALFNWLYARQHGGQFILRIDDTDQQRNVAEALRPILDGFRWLGLTWDEGPENAEDVGTYFQSARTHQYQQAVQQLLENGHAYYDYARPEELQAEREAAEKQKETFAYSRRWMADNDEKQQAFEAEGRKPVVRLKMPRDGKLTIEDQVRGTVEFPWIQEQDHVIQRTDGSCLYHLATVVDDHDFRISHVIRAEEHLSNTPRQVFIATALGYELPIYAHVPYVAEPGSRTKLSKRKLEKYLKNREFAKLNNHGQRIAERMGTDRQADTFNPVIVDFYREIGCLPHALLNYLLLLGWSLDDRTEFLSMEQMIENFSLERVNKAPASFDPAKLMAFQSHYMQQVPLKQATAMVLPFLQRADLVTSPPPCDIGPRLQKIISAAGDRLAVAGDILDFDFLFVEDQDLQYDQKAFAKRIDNEDAPALLRDFSLILADLEPFEASQLEQALKQFVADRNLKIGQIIHALRVAVTGQAVGFGMFETLEILGRESSLKRIQQSLDRLDA